MSHSPLYPKTSEFYPTGNTSPINLTQNIPPEKSARILLLGCGDPRNILYTVYSAELDETTFPRTFDFTCCDVEPAILARNFLLFSLLSESDTSIDEMWNIFYDFFLKRSCFELLTAHSRRLLNCSEDLETWNRSKYGQFLKFCSCHTLGEVRHFWRCYADFDELPASRKDNIKSSFMNGMKSMQGIFYPWSFGRSAGPLILEALEPISAHYAHFWKTGINSMDSQDRGDADLLNPAFVYSTRGEGFAVSRGMYCPVGFHLALAFTDIKDGPAHRRNPHSAQSVITSTRAQFSAWCQAFKKVINGSCPRVTIRGFAGDALAFCNALQYCSATSSISTPFCVVPWKGSLIILDEVAYSTSASFPAPVTFDVIDTSNLTDSLGLLNVFTIANPLLERRPTSILYTETLLCPEDNAESHFKKRFCGDMTTICILLDIVPSDLLSRFTTSSNLHELLSHEHLKSQRYHNMQFHERMSWKILSLIDPPSPRTSTKCHLSLAFEPHHLANVLFDVYRKMFSDEDPFFLTSLSFIKRVQARNHPCYFRASYVALLRVIQTRIHEKTWDDTMDALFSMLEEDETLLLGGSNYQDLCCQFHYYNVYSVGPFFPDSRVYHTYRESEIFRGWLSVPTMACLTLVIPRTHLRKLEELDTFGTLLLWCEINSQKSHTFHPTFRPIFGRLVSTGAHDQRQLSIEEDNPGGWSSASDLIVSLWVPTYIITIDPTITQVGFRLQPSTATEPLEKIFGPDLMLFTASLLDKERIYITRERPDCPGEVEKIRAIRFAHFDSPSTGEVGVQMKMDKARTQIASFTRRADISDAKAQEALINGALVSEEQLSPCAIKISFGGFEEIVFFPFPVDGKRTRLRVARRSHYIEVITTPISEINSPGEVFVNQLPTNLDGTSLMVRNIHRINLDRLPTIDTSDKVCFKRWLPIHVSLSLSDREVSMPNLDERMDQDISNTLMAVKKTLCKLFLRYTGVQDRGAFSVFALDDPAHGGIYMLLFVTALRLDLPVHTVVLDAYALPITRTRAESMQNFFSELGYLSIVTAGTEARAWKGLLPVLAERCRTTWVHGADCAYSGRGTSHSLENAENPLCSCGEGQDGDEFAQFSEWSDAAPFVTRVALSPLFVVSYLEPDGPPKVMEKWTAMWQAMKNSAPVTQAVSGTACARCGRSEAKLVNCSRCKRTKYCSVECQKVDWKQHKTSCK